MNKWKFRRIILINPFWYFGGVETISYKFLKILEYFGIDVVLFILIKDIKNVDNKKFLKIDDPRIIYLDVVDFVERYKKFDLKKTDMTILMRPKFYYEKDVESAPCLDLFQDTKSKFGLFNFGNYENSSAKFFEDYLNISDFILTHHNYIDDNTFNYLGHPYKKKNFLLSSNIIAPAEYEKLIKITDDYFDLKNLKSIIYSGRFSFERDLKKTFEILNYFQKNNFNIKILGAVKDYRAVNYIKKINFSHLLQKWEKSYNFQNISLLLKRFSFGIYLRKIASEKYYNEENCDFLENSVLEYIVNGVIPIISSSFKKNPYNLNIIKEENYESILFLNKKQYKSFAKENLNIAKEKFSPQNFFYRFVKFTERIF